MQVAQVILGMQAGLNRSKQVSHVRKEFVDTDSLLEKTPETFDKIEHRTIRREPEDPHAMFKETQGRHGRRTLVVGCIVQDQHDRTRWVRMDQEMLKKSNEMLTVLAFRSLPSDGIAAPVVSRKEMMRTLLPRCGNAFLLTSLHPTSP